MVGNMEKGICGNWTSTLVGSCSVDMMCAMRPVAVTAGTNATCD
jgi:hypothetical protein